MASLSPRWLRLLNRFRSDKQTAPPRRLALDLLETRDTPAVGGGFTDGGLVGEYFDNPTLSGEPSFTRRDVRVDFDWGTRAPGGSTSGAFREVGADRFSVRWTGQFIPKFSEPYTFRVTSDDGVKLWIKPEGTANWNELASNWNPHAEAVNTRSIALVAGKTYDVRMEYFELTGSATAKLWWSSPSTPLEVIDPAVNLGVNVAAYDFHSYADATKSGRAEWGDPHDYFGRDRAGVDANGWPTEDAGHIFWEGQDPMRTAGTYQLRFRGRAEVVAWFDRGRFKVNGIEYVGKLPEGAGYDAATNTTVATVVVRDADLFGLTFRRTRRDVGGGINTGVTDVKLLRPIAPGSTTHYGVDETFDRGVKSAMSRFTVLRHLTANFNGEKDWHARKLPSHLKAAWGDRAGVWEYQVMLANETGKDLYVTLPIDATDDYVRKLGNLIKYGSDGVNPYTSHVGSPKWPGLNPNLRVYVEWGNEVWNWGFSQAMLGHVSGKAAVKNNTPEGRIVNFDGQRPNGDFRRWTALRTVQASNAFRSIWGDAAMGERVRFLLEYQYDNHQYTALEALRFLDDYFNNGDGKNHVADPKPVSHYLWGAGGATYFGAANPRGLLSDVFVPDGSFEGVGLDAGRSQVRPGVAGWTFTGDAGVYREHANSTDNARIGISGFGVVPAPLMGTKALYLSGKATATVTIDFPRAGTYAIDFRGASELVGSANPLDFFLDGQRVTPDGAHLKPNIRAWVPGTGEGRDASKFALYGTVPVTVTKAGKLTLKIVGRGKASQTTLLDDFRVASTDAIFATRLPGGGASAGQVSDRPYQQQVTSQAKWAQAYGLKVVAYEGGWSLGGDTQQVPLMSYAKHRDPRAATAMAEAIDAFHKAGGELNVLGTYEQWEADDSLNASGYGLVRGIDKKLGELPVAPTAGIVVPGAIPVSGRSTDAVEGTNDNGIVKPGEWVSWNVIVPTTGNYRVATQTTGGGRVKVFVAGKSAATGGSGGGVSGTVRLTAGMHTLRVQSLGGTFTIKDVSVTRL